MVLYYKMVPSGLLVIILEFSASIKKPVLFFRTFSIEQQKLEERTKSFWEPYDFFGSFDQP